jgi:multiple RNA-binding domain-containing protein 1
MKEQGFNIDLLEKKTDRTKCIRSKSILLVKNIPFSMDKDELKELFERYGKLIRTEISPFNTLGLLEFEKERQAKKAISKL